MIEKEKQIDAQWLKDQPNCVHANILLNPHSKVDDEFVAQLAENRKKFIEKIFEEHKEMSKTCPEAANALLQVQLIMLF